MSVTLTTSNFTQFEKGMFITEAVIGLDTVNNGLLYVADGVKNDQYTFPQLKANTGLQPYASTPKNQSTNTTLSNRNVTLGRFMAYEQFDPNIFENHWQQDELVDKIIGRSIPATFMSYLGAYYTEKTFVPIENMIHMGSTTYSQTPVTGSAFPPTYDANGNKTAAGGVNSDLIYFDGIIKQALNATTPALQVASPSNITSANILAKMDAAKNLMPIALLSSANRYKRLRYIMGVVDYQKYEEALTSTTFKNNDTTEKGINRYKGYDVVVCAGVPEHTFYFAEATTDVRSNLQLAITSLDNISFVIDRLQNNSSEYFYKAIVKMGVGIAKPSEFVIHTTHVLADFSA